MPGDCPLCPASGGGGDFAGPYMYRARRLSNEMSKTFFAGEEREEEEEEEENGVIVRRS